MALSGERKQASCLDTILGTGGRFLSNDKRRSERRNARLCTGRCGLSWGAAGVIALGTIALNRGETINAVRLVIAAVFTYLIAYRFYSLFIATKVLQVERNRATRAARHNDGLDYVPLISFGAGTGRARRLQLIIGHGREQFAVLEQIEEA
jgi:hypothetical protein